MDSEFIKAISATADTSFDLDNPINFITGQPITDPVVRSLITNPTLANRRSGSEVQGFYRPGERPTDGTPFETVPTKCPPYQGPPSGRMPNDEEKRGAWHLQDEYLAGRLGKDETENGRLWNTVKWIERHYRIASTPRGAIPPLSIHIADAILQGSGSPNSADDESPDPKQENEGIAFERINAGKADGAGRMKVVDGDGVTRTLEIETDDFTLQRLVDQLDECSAQAKIEVGKLVREAVPLPELTDCPVADDFVESGKIISILKAGMLTLWNPVINAVAHRVTMSSLGRSQGVGNDKAATVGRWRLIEGLRLAESIRRALERQKVAPKQKPAWRKHTNVPSVAEMMPPLVAKSARTLATSESYLNQTAGPVIKISDKPLVANDNHKFYTIASKAS